MLSDLYKEILYILLQCVNKDIIIILSKPSSFDCYRIWKQVYKLSIEEIQCV